MHVESKKHGLVMRLVDISARRPVTSQDIASIRRELAMAERVDAVLSAAEALSWTVGAHV